MAVFISSQARPRALARLTGGSALLLCLGLPAAAQQGQDLVSLPPLALSGGLSTIAADAYGRAHSVLTREDIAARGLTRVQDALRALPGVSVSGAGASYTQLRIRGGEASHTLLLIDGVPAAGGDGEYSLAGLETANIERIEVLRGPQSVFYGSNASAGVVNIITRQPEQGQHFGTSLEMGNGHAASAYVSQRGERGGLSLDLASRRDKGYDQSGDGGERDAIARDTLGLKGDYALTPDLRLGTSLRWSDEIYDNDSTSWMATDADSYVIDDPNQHSDRNEFTGALWAEYSAAQGRVQHRLEFQNTVVKQSFNDAPATRGETEALKYRLGLSLDGQAFAAAAHQLNLLLEDRRDRSSAAPDYRRDMRSLALEYRAFLDSGLDLQAGLRHDDNKVFDDFTGWSLGLSYRIAETGLRLHAGAGRAQVNPSFYELYANDGWTLGNPHLAPEENRGFDIGLEATVLAGRGLVDITYFNEKLSNEITYIAGAASDGSGRASYANQSGTSPRQGIEITAKLQARPGLDLGLSYTYLDAENPDGSTETRRPAHELGLQASLALLDDRARLNADLRYVAGNYDTQNWGGYETRKLPDYATLNLGGSYALSDQTKLTARVVNVFDKDHSDVWGYASQGRTVYAGLTTQW